MAAIRPPIVEERSEFREQAEHVKTTYPEIESVLDEFREALVMDYDLPHVPIGLADNPGVCAVKLDYPPRGVDGLGRFLLTYHTGERKPSMRDPLCCYTLVSIRET